MKKLIQIAVFAVTLISITIISPGALLKALASDNSATIWWPTDGYHAGGPQPFKAVVNGIAIEEYDMYWQVDGGSLNPMDNNYTDAPHKETTVDLSGWTWHGTGPYTINFVAKQSGAIIGQRSITMYNDLAPSASAPAPAPAPVAIVADVNQAAVSNATPSAPAAPNSVAPGNSAPAVSNQPTAAAAPAPVAASPTQDVQVWWPTVQTTLRGSVPLKAVVPGMSLAQYTMYWSVDGGAQNVMLDNNTDAPHKEALVDVSNWHWQQSGNYTFTFIAKDQSGAVVAQNSVPVVINPSTTNIQTSAAAPVFTALAKVLSTNSTQQMASVAQAAPAPAPQTSNGSNPLAGQTLYVNQYSGAAAQANAWRQSRPADASAMDTLANQPTAQWFGDWNGDISHDVHAAVAAAQSKGQTPVLVAYNIPGRDCGGYSSGGTNSPSGYRSWIQSFANAIGDSPAVVIVEPDALAGMNCLNPGDQQTRLSLLSDAVNALKSKSHTAVYLDAGHNGWVDVSTMASRLSSANISRADGFALNVSNFGSTADNTNYGAKISAAVGGKHFVVDTSRNGNGADGNWCNPSGRAMGAKPTTSTGNPAVDAYLWIKTPGESDGNCNGGPSAGNWWGDYALGLVRNSH
jgi:endoglucanase